MAAALNILFLTQILPYPPDAGPRVKTWQVLRYLVESGHKVTLVSFVRADEEKHIKAVRELLPDFHPVKMVRSRAADLYYWMRSNFTGRPFLIERDRLAAMSSLVKMLMETCPYDAIHTDQLTMTQFAFDLHCKERPILRLFDAHNATWSIVDRMRENAMPLLQPVMRLEAQRIKRYEGEVVREFDYTLAVTEIDRDLLLEAARNGPVGQIAANGSTIEEAALERRILTVPISVDTRVLHAAPRPKQSSNLMALGTLHYPPNADGIRWFLHEVFPIVREQRPDACLTIIGKNPPPDFIEQAEKYPQVIEVTGYVDDLEPYFEQSALMVVPVRAGGGMRVRILEGFARGIPTVTTTIGLEGIDARPDEDVLIGDTPEKFAAAVLRLLDQPELREKLANNGRRLVEKVYDRQVALRKMESIYHQGTIPQ